MKQKIYWGLGTMAIVMALSIAFAFNLGSVIEEDGIVLRFVSGTEYISGQSGKVIVEILDKNYNAVSTASCTVGFLLENDLTNQYILPSITSPNGMWYESAQSKTYIYNFTAPSKPGIYQYKVKCVNAAKNYIQTKSFHVSAPTDFVWIGEGPDVVSLGENVEFVWRLDALNEYTITDAKCGVYKDSGEFSGIGKIFYESVEQGLDRWNNFRWCVYIPTCASVTPLATKSLGTYGDFDYFNTLGYFVAPLATGRVGGYAANITLGKTNGWTLKSDYTDGGGSGRRAIRFLEWNCTQPAEGQPNDNGIGCNYYGIENSNVSGEVGTWFSARYNGVYYDYNISSFEFGTYNPAGVAAVGWYELNNRIFLSRINETRFNFIDIAENGSVAINSTFDVPYIYTDIFVDKVYMWGYVNSQHNIDDFSISYNNMNMSYVDLDSLNRRSAVFGPILEKNLFKANFNANSSILSAGRYYLDCDATYAKFWDNGEGSKFWDGNGKLRKYFDVRSGLRAWVQK